MMRSILSLFLVWTLVTTAKEQDGDLCFNCKCFNNVIDCTSSDLEKQPNLGEFSNNTKELHLTNNALRKVYVFEFSKSLFNLSLRHNFISFIEDRAFEKLLNLTSLDLSHNIITSEALKPITFKGSDFAKSPGTSSLKVLNLGSNVLHTLHQDLFEFLFDLEELYLSSNPFRVLDHGTLVALSSLIKLKVLDLSSTQLSSIPSNWLNAAKYLETLNLGMNNLTSVPPCLEESRNLRHLILDNNPIAIISYFPKLTTLESLHMSYMQKLVSVKAHSLVNLSSLVELRLSFNNYLVEISEDALVEPGFYSANQPSKEGAIFPPLRKLVLNDNRLRYLEERLMERWDKLSELNLEANPWVCDCKNQWIVSTLIPLMNKLNIGSPQTLICGEPVEMKGMSMSELAMNNYEMRCLDMYNNEPDRDAKVLIIVLVVVLVAIPISLLFLHLIRRPRGNSGYPSAYYRRAQSFETIN